MSNIKFKLMLKEVSFEYEGDRDSGRQILDSLSKNLDTISELQSKAVGVNTFSRNTPKQLLSDGSNQSLSRRGRKPKTLESSPLEAPGKRRRNRRNRSGVSVAQHIAKLIDENYFSSHRSLADIKSELAKNGIKVEQHQISSPLLYLTKRGIMSRSDATGKWMYFATESSANSRPIRVIKKSAS